jgi:hypothetical protein
MVTPNPYLAYKRDTSRLTYWIITTSNHIVASCKTLPDDTPRVLITNGQVTVSGL